MYCIHQATNVYKKDTQFKETVRTYVVDCIIIIIIIIIIITINCNWVVTRWQ